MPVPSICKDLTSFINGNSMARAACDFLHALPGESRFPLDDNFEFGLGTGRTSRPHEAYAAQLSLRCNAKGLLFSHRNTGKSSRAREEILKDNLRRRTFCPHINIGI
eukprot:GEZU01026141.1.p4 GENE.GEZU01026141.1~~GEZU01026141.1.p4  ORF type:complete len:107 (-),score=4.84 GEZU01026141.1:462-782(-)